MGNSTINKIISFILSLFKKPMENKPEPVIIPEPIIPPPVIITPQQRLYDVAKASLGHDASPRDVANDELACMESVDEIHKKARGFYINGTKDKVTLSTDVAYLILRTSPYFVQVFEYEKGCIILSPTNHGNGELDHGHIGITAKYGILSNDSNTGLFKENYTLKTWSDRYVAIGGYPMLFFKPI